jgi:predicted dienelactone hydrolase
MALAAAAGACGGSTSSPTGAAAYGAHGPFAVGYRRLEAPAPAGGAPLVVKAWHPAQNAARADETITYDVALKFQGWEALSPAVAHGHALAGAPVDGSGGPYPIVLFSHGFALAPEWYATLVERYASHGFVVLAPEHGESDWFAAANATFDRPRDVARTLDLAAALAAPASALAGGELAGRLDLSRVAVVGHSYGGYTALAAAGARIDLPPFEARCAGLSADDPKQFLCAPFVGRGGDMAARAGLPAVPTGLWPSMGDARVKAIVSMAGDAYLFGAAGLASVTVPVLALGGTEDFGTPWDWGAKPTYEHTGSARKALAAFEGAGHMIAANPCSDLPFTGGLPDEHRALICEDGAWERLRALELIAHLSTAFLRDVLVDDPRARAALAPGAVRFPGIGFQDSVR